MIFEALQKAFANLFRPKVLMIVLLPTAITLMLWIGILVIFWGGLIAFTQGVLLDSFLVTWPHKFINLFLNIEPISIAGFLAATFILFSSIPLMYVTNLLLVSVLLLPMMLPLIAGADYPQLQKKRGGTTIGSLVNSLWATFLFCGGIIITFPLWIIPGFPMLLPMVFNAYLNQKVFLYDVWQDYASEQERIQILQNTRLDRFALGLLTAFLNYIPFVNILSATLTALCFIHYGLTNLSSYRQDSSSQEML